MMDRAFRLVGPSVAEASGRIASLCKGSRENLGNHAIPASERSFSHIDHILTLNGKALSELEYIGLLQIEGEDLVGFSFSKNEHTGRIRTSFIETVCGANGVSQGRVWHWEGYRHRVPDRSHDVEAVRVIFADHE